MVSDLTRVKTRKGLTSKVGTDRRPARGTGECILPVSPHHHLYPSPPSWAPARRFYFHGPVESLDRVTARCPPPSPRCGERCPLLSLLLLLMLMASGDASRRARQHPEGVDSEASGMDRLTRCGECRALLYVRRKGTDLRPGASFL